jgi:hypothetical protein
MWFFWFWRWRRFWDAAERRAELHEDLKDTCAAQRALLEGRRDYFLERDMAELKEEEKSKKPPGQELPPRRDDAKERQEE